VDGGAEALGGGGGDGLWCACSEINLFKKIVLKNCLKKRPTHTPQPWAVPLVFSFLFCFRTPGIAAELRAVITARGSRYFLVRAAWATAAVCGFYYF
jgi:hypothetical protein